VTFDSAEFVDACAAALSETDPIAAVTEAVQAAIARGTSIDDALGTETSLEPLTLFSAPDLTVQRILWPSGALSSIHDHRMWAVVGVYAGCEVNRLYQRSAHGLSELKGREVRAGTAPVLDADAVHSAGNPRREWTAGLHVYGGDILGVSRSGWDPGGNELPYDEAVAPRRAIVQALRDFASEQGEAFTADDRFAAVMALWVECENRRRHLTPTEAREVILASWKPTA